MAPGAPLQQHGCGAPGAPLQQHGCGAPLECVRQHRLRLCLVSLRQHPNHPVHIKHRRALLMGEEPGVTYELTAPAAARRPLAPRS